MDKIFPVHLSPHRVLTGSRSLCSVLGRLDFGVGLPYPLLEVRVGWVSTQGLPRLCRATVVRWKGEACGDLHRRLQGRAGARRSASAPPSYQSPLRRRQMLLDGVPPEAELQADVDVGVPLSVELLSTLEVICGEASLAAGRLRGLAADSLHRGSGCADLPSDRSGRHAGGLKAQDLLLLRRADRTAGRLADAACRRGLARFCRRRYTSRARLRSNLTLDETLAEGEQG